MERGRFFEINGSNITLAINSVIGLKNDKNLVEQVSTLVATTREHAKHIAQIKVDYDILWKANENLSNDIKNLQHENEILKQKDEKLGQNYENLMSENKRLRHDYENLQAQNMRLSQNYENLRKNTEHLKSFNQGYLNDRYDSYRNLTDGRLQYLETITLQITPRTCQTLADMGVKQTGTYFVDPDGVLRGDPPIQVLCDMETALSSGDTHNAWWKDRHGNPQYYWDGSNAGRHVCNCGLSKKCIHRSSSCNCDAEAPQWESDTGTIRNRTALPITELRFGGLQFDGQKASHNLGGLVCRGKAPSPDNPAESCSSLRQAGNAETGYHLITNKKGRLDVVLCRMDLEETDPKFQMGTSARIAREVVYFDVYDAAGKAGGVIHFSGTEVNIGGGMNPSSGVFTAPLDGIYVFHFHTWTHSTVLMLYFRKNGDQKAHIYSHDYSNGAYDVHEQMPGQTFMLHLLKGDTLDVYLDNGLLRAKTLDNKETRPRNYYD
ncbi:unnamed protein product [Darwinula stevensoni]|uniref:C1q domain-containing protein n=1 Tax=Darwinula stevensoni TaxID=69355 RepID=A0A7R9A624_9CRUS|nr:unnamed protein product [Darwinula stevensoni]CAG0893240.1 unnamed protein product [Darwinula stevensoni]